MKILKILPKRKTAAILLIVAIASVAVIKGFTQQGSESFIPEGSNHSINITGQSRSYALFVPKSLPTNQDTPLVVMLHGALGTSAQAEEAYNWDAKASEEKFIVAYPEGLNRSWVVSEGCCGPSVKKDISDVEFIERMVDDIKNTYSIDERRIYATGISNGGALAYRLACDTTMFASVGVVAANLLGDCPSPSPISIMHIHGLADQTFPYAGGGGKRNNDGQGERPADTRGPSIPSLMNMWREINNCELPIIKSDGLVTKNSSQCDNTKAVELVTIEGAGHQWPGSLPNTKASKLFKLDPPSTLINATNILWDFFKAHPK